MLVEDEIAGSTAKMIHKDLRIEMRPIGFVRRDSTDEDERDGGLVARLVFDKRLALALDGVEGWSHIYVLFWLDRVGRTGDWTLHHSGRDLGVLATRSPIHPNGIGLTLVELVKREENILWVRGLDALDGTPVLDIKPYPDWERGRYVVVSDFRVPAWLTKIVDKQP